VGYVEIENAIPEQGNETTSECRLRNISKIQERTSVASFFSNKGIFIATN